MTSTPIARQQPKKKKSESSWTWEDTLLLLFVTAVVVGSAFVVTNFQLSKYATHEEVMRDKAFLVSDTAIRLNDLEMKVSRLDADGKMRAADSPFISSDDKGGFLHCGNGWEYRGELMPAFEICKKISELEEEPTSEEHFNNDIPSCDAGQTSNRTKQSNAKAKGQSPSRRH